MGMILGLMAANIGLKLGQTGLKIPDPPNPHFVLSVNFDDIMDFLGLSREVYNSGFKTRMEVYEWVCTMKWFDPYMFRPTGQGIAKLKPDRTMYAEFVLFVTNNWSISESERIRKRDDKKSRDALFQTVKLEALNYFDKTAQFETRLESRRIQQRTQAVFSGHRVRDWAELGEHWKGVKMIMDKIREMLGGERKVLEFYDSNGEDALRALVVAVRDDLGIYRRAT
ncbi:hypothetical protein CC1G_02988 [Coprinopsis cinerea okayama7|uniref:Uncharacterized protein n=1 Tax=Coprinopsis cinerea (strain Okayama-7 / 130 / ATCC MYA-4618 / FGSC 9003) TaxID=240176 RepID=A8NS01_COPC7|nr:hypothetical protein CC1G_02988 [Coprinopsis cinerea okayama7\|eukprot:XP_001835900.2 hypothetical protein CC1G_02988 [Coprinopsis cinerea okayama7\